MSRVIWCFTLHFSFVSLSRLTRRLRRMIVNHAMVYPVRFPQKCHISIYQPQYVLFQYYCKCGLKTFVLPFLLIWAGSVLKVDDSSRFTHYFILVFIVLVLFINLMYWYSFYDHFVLERQNIGKYYTTLFQFIVLWIVLLISSEIQTFPDTIVHES